MGPILLFDKSFLQSLTVDEAVWFDHFFLTNVCPVFYVETLADLKEPAPAGVHRKKLSESSLQYFQSEMGGRTFITSRHAPRIFSPKASRTAARSFYRQWRRP